jgi:hypothetical protein
MSSNINPNNINGNFPVAGQDNDSQGFRDNFTNILNNFSFASSEITDVQNSVNNIRLVISTSGNVSPFYANVDRNLTVNQTSSLLGDVTASANVTIAGNLIVTGNIYETGTITINQQEIVAGNITTSGNIVANNITTLAGTNGNLSLDPDGSGWITANGNIRVSGNISNVAGLQVVAIGNVTPGTAVFTTATTGGLQATAIGNVTPGTGAFTTVTIGNVTLGNLLVSNNSTVSQNLNVTGNITAGNISTPAGGLITTTVLAATGITVTGNVNANGGNIVTTSSNVLLFNATATTVNAFGAATTINVGNASGNTNITGFLTVSSAIQFANLTTTQIDAIAPTNSGMTVYNYTTGNVQVYNGTKWANITLS